MLLAVSVGNSHITFGVCDAGSWVKRWRVQTVPAKTMDEYVVIFRALFDAARLDASRFDETILASVVPPLTGTIAAAIGELSGRVPLQVTPELDLGLRITTENPWEVGADLVANAVAALDRTGGNCIVVDFGTALSFTAVSAKRELRGVAIAPGLSSAVNSLGQDTAQLPRVPIAAPAAAIGRNSTQSIQAGIVFGYVGLVHEVVRRMRVELGGSADVIATGGHSPVMAPLLAERVTHEQWLTLEGLRILALRNMTRQASAG